MGLRPSPSVVARLESQGFAEGAVRASLQRILQDSEIASIATVAPGHRAHIHTAYVAPSPDLEFYFLSDPASVHAQNLARNPSMSMAVFRTSQHWGSADRGAQLFGTAGRVPAGARTREATRIYGRRFPLYARWIRGRRLEERVLADGVQTLSFFRFAPDRLQLLDEGKFGAATFVNASIRRTRRR